MAGRFDISADRGATVSAQWMLTYGDGSGIPLSDYTVQSEIKHKKSDALPSASFAVSTSGSYLTLSLSSGVSSLLDCSVYWYDVRMTHNTSSAVLYPFGGKLLVSNTVTE